MAAPTVNIATPISGSSFQSWGKPSAKFSRTRVLDFAEAVTKKGSALVNGNTIDIMPFYAGELVTNVISRILVAGTASCTVTVGDDATAAGFMASLAVDGAANTVANSTGSFIFTQAGSSAYAVTWVGGKFYTATNALRIALSSGTTAEAQAGKIEFTAEIVELSTRLTL